MFNIYDSDYDEMAGDSFDSINEAAMYVLTDLPHEDFMYMIGTDGGINAVVFQSQVYYSEAIAYGEATARAEAAVADRDGWKLLYQDSLDRELKQQARAEAAEVEVAFANALAETQKAGMRKVQDRNALLVAREEAAKAEVERLREENDILASKLNSMIIVRGMALACSDEVASTYEAAEAEVKQARRTAEYWKAEHLAGNAEIERLRAELDDTAAQYVALLDRTSDW
jgi:hypothetical protein